MDGATGSNSNGDTASTRALMLGVFDSNGVITQYFPGSIGKCGILNSAATATEIAAIRAGTLRT